MRHLMLTALLALASCGPAQTAAPAIQSEAQSERAPLAPAGEPVQLSRLDADSNLAWAASVVQLDTLADDANGGIKLFGLAGGDPAMNGLYTYIAFFENPGSGWRVFQLGDFLAYRILADAPGRVDLEIQESVMDEANGAIGSRTRYVIVTWTRGDDGAPPATISVAPAHT